MLNHARRLFCFDVQHAHILAEATQTLSLHDDGKTNDLWLGYATISRGSFVFDPNPDEHGDKPVNVIMDLREDARFCGLPYVAGAPHMRFYAGVPITTSRHINIGAFCILDDKARSEFSAEDKAFMRHMSINIMTHLDQVRAQAYHTRGVRMVEALDTFVGGNLTRHPVNYQSNLPKERSFDTSTQDSQQLSDSDMPQQVSVVRRKRVPTSRGNNESVQDTTTAADLEERPVTESQVPSAPAAPPPTDSQPNNGAFPADDRSAVGSTADELHSSIVAPNVASTFERAARLLRQALDVSQIQFLDASVGSFGELVGDTNRGEEALSDSRTDSSTDPLQAKAEDPNKPCYLLGESHSDLVHSRNASALPSERFLTKILHRYPAGKIWNMDGEDESTSSDDGHVKVAMSSEQPALKPPNSKHGQIEMDERFHMQSIYPSAKSLAVGGLWDHRHNRWFAAFVLWTSSELQLVSREGELHFVAAFCDVLMAEIHRLEIERSDRAKTDFISSISHELRSPLHGILGSAELLSGQPLDDFSNSLAAQISTCGRNLLDIIENLLDYSNINFKAKRNRSRLQKNATQDQNPGPATTSNATTPSAIMTVEDDVALDTITEEIVVASITSFRFTHAASHTNAVITILDLDKPVSRCKLPVGGWKRVCVNIVTNALKHTQDGHVYIGLKTERIDGSPDCFKAILTVTDSGQGMSEDFIAKDLFTPFKQEDSFTEGTGLGMHIVSRIVKAFGGTIDVRSDQAGGGTRVVVTVPLYSSNSAINDFALSPTGQTVPTFSRLPVGVIDCASSSASLGPVRLKSRKLQMETLVKTCHGLGCATTTLRDWNVMDTSDVSLATEADLAHLLQSETSTGDRGVFVKPMIVICNDIKSEQELRLILAEVLSNHIVYIREPAGPAMIAKAISSILDAEPSDHGSAPGESANPLEEATESSLQSKQDDSTRPLSHPKRSELQRTDSDPQLRPSSATLNRSIRRHIQSSKSDSPGTGSPSLKLLVVEDNKVNQRLLVAYGRKQGHKCITANNGLEAIDVYKEEIPVSDNSSPTASESRLPVVVLMDINMPVMNGFESTRQIRLYERQHDLEPARIIALTGLGSADAQREAHTSGCDIFLTKPVQFNQLAQFLHAPHETTVH